MTRKLLGNLSKGLVFILSAPAGTGKTTLMHRLCREFSCIEASISSTTRSPRIGEIDGRDYYFLSPESFQAKVEKNEFLEHANVFGQMYGTTKSQVENIVAKGHHVILVIDTQGAKQLMEIGFPATYIFLAPPSLDVLAKRLALRQSEAEKEQEKRLSCAKREMEQATFYDYYVINDDIDVAYNVLRSIFIAEENKNKKIKRKSDETNANK